MTAPPPAYVPKYEVETRHESALVIRTRYFGIYNDAHTRTLQYWLDGKEARSAEFVVLRTCYDAKCGRKGKQHSHDVMGRSFISIEGATLYTMNEQTNIQNNKDPMDKRTRDTADCDLSENCKLQYCLIHHPEQSKDDTDLEPEIQETPQEEEDTTDDDWEPEPIKFVVVETTKTYMVVVTNYWRALLCTRPGCDNNIEYRHPIFDPDISPREYIRKIKIDFCQDKECKYHNRVHAHQDSDEEPTEIDLPAAVAEIIWGKQPESLNMMVEHISIVEMLKDDRVEKEYIVEQFECVNMHCPMFYSNHKHLFNMDPDNPKTAIILRLIEHMMENGRVYNRQGCEWRQYLHVHFAKNE